MSAKVLSKAFGFLRRYPWAVTQEDWPITLPKACAEVKPITKYVSGNLGQEACVESVFGSYLRDDLAGEQDVVRRADSLRRLQRNLILHVLVFAVTRDNLDATPGNLPDNLDDGVSSTCMRVAGVKLSRRLVQAEPVDDSVFAYGFWP